MCSLNSKYILVYLNSLLIVSIACINGWGVGCNCKCGCSCTSPSYWLQTYSYADLQNLYNSLTRKFWTQARSETNLVHSSVVINHQIRISNEDQGKKSMLILSNFTYLTWTISCRVATENQVGFSRLCHDFSDFAGHFFQDFPVNFLTFFTLFSSSVHKFGRYRHLWTLRFCIQLSINILKLAQQIVSL